MVRDFRGTHEIQGLIGSHETRRMCDCGCARPEGPLGVTEYTKDRLYWGTRVPGSWRGSHEIEGMGMSLWELQGFWGVRIPEGTGNQWVKQEPRGC